MFFISDYSGFVFIKEFKDCIRLFIRLIMFQCKISQDFDHGSVTLLDRRFNTLKEISNELGLTYQQVADLSSRKTKKEYQKFKYYPKIEIQRIAKNRQSNI